MADTTDEELKLKAEAFRLLRLNVAQNKKKRFEMGETEDMMSRDGVSFVMKNRRKEVLELEKDDFCVGECYSFLPDIQRDAIDFFDKELRKVLSQIEMMNKEPQEICFEIKDKMIDFVGEWVDTKWDEYMDIDGKDCDKNGDYVMRINFKEALSLFGMMCNNAKKHKKTILDATFKEMSEGRFICRDMDCHIGTDFFNLVTYGLDYSLIIDGKEVWLIRY